MENRDKEKRALLKNFTEELPVLRARAKVSQEVVADLIGISRQTYSAIESGKRELPWKTFMSLVALFQNIDQTKPMLTQIDGFRLLEDILPQKKTNE